MTVSERVPSRSGSALKLGASMMVKFGANDSQVGSAGRAEQVAAEDAGPGRLGEGPHGASMGRVGAHEAVALEDLALGHVLDDARPQRFVARLADGAVETCPPDAVVAARFVDEVLVLG